MVLTDPRTAPSVFATLIAGQPVEVFAVACLSTKYWLLAWHVVSRGTRASTPVSMPDVFVPACLTPGTTGLIVVHNDLRQHSRWDTGAAGPVDAMELAWHRAKYRGNQHLLLPADPGLVGLKIRVGCKPSCIEAR